TAGEPATPGAQAYPRRNAMTDSERCLTGDPGAPAGFDIIRVQTVVGLRLAEYFYRPHSLNPLHSHAADHFYIVIQGACSETDRRGTFQAAPGTLVFHPAGERHSNLTSPEGARVFGIEMQRPWRERVQT